MVCDFGRNKRTLEMGRIEGSYGAGIFKAGV